MLDVECLAFDQVEQTAGRADDDIHAAIEPADLRAIRLPAIDRQDAHVEMLSIFGHGIGHLQSKLARRREDKTLHVTLRCEVVENGESEGSGLACACLRLADHICSLEHDRDDGGLNGRGLGIAKPGNGLHELFAQVKRSKIGCHLYPYKSLRLRDDASVVRKMFFPVSMQCQWEQCLAMTI